MANSVELGLGTVQFGMDYGVSNALGKVPLSMAGKIINKARQHGIRVLDTASSYGDSEKALGEITGGDSAFRVITKLPGVQGDTVDSASVDDLRAVFEQSLVDLRRESVAGLLLHRPEDLLKPGAERLYALLQLLKSEGKTGKIGVSISGIERSAYEEIDLLFSRYTFDCVQVAQSVFDQELFRRGTIESLKSSGVEIHVRSVFLQGLLLMEPSELDRYFDPISHVIEDWREFLADSGLTAVEAAIAFMRDCVRPDVILAGCAHVDQLAANIRAFEKESPGDIDFSRFALSERQFTNPFFWKTGRQ